MILKMIYDGDGEEKYEARKRAVTELVGRGWQDYGQITMIKQAYTHGAPYDFYLDNGQWHADEYFDNIVAGLDDPFQLIVTMYVVPITIEVDTDDFVRDAEALLKGLPRP